MYDPAVKITRFSLGLAALLLAACHHHVHPQPQHPPTTNTPPHPEATPTTPVAKAAEDVIVSAWSEPKRLPPGGGQAQILVRLRKKGGAPYAGVEVRLETSTGSLFSNGRILTTDAAGMTRDRLTAHQGATVTVNAGGTLYRFEVPVSTE